MPLSAFFGRSWLYSRRHASKDRCPLKGWQWSIASGDSSPASEVAMHQWLDDLHQIGAPIVALPLAWRWIVPRHGGVLRHVDAAFIASASWQIVDPQLPMREVGYVDI